MSAGDVSLARLRALSIVLSVEGRQPVRLNFSPEKTRELATDGGSLGAFVRMCLDVVGQDLKPGETTVAHMPRVGDVEAVGGHGRIQVVKGGG